MNQDLFGIALNKLRKIFVSGLSVIIIITLISAAFLPILSYAQVTIPYAPGFYIPPTGPTNVTPYAPAPTGDPSIIPTDPALNPIEPGILPGNSDIEQLTQSLLNGTAGGQAAGVTGGNNAQSGGISGQGVAGAAQGLTSCISGAAAAKKIKDAMMLKSTETYVRVNTSQQRNFEETGAIDQPTSFNAVANCIVNALIKYIYEATVAWINSGFNGNPAFINNPGKFFGDIAAIETAGFVNDFMRGGAAGLNIPQEYRGMIARGLIQPNTGGRGNGGGMSSFFNPQNIANDFTNASVALAQRRSQEVINQGTQALYNQGWLNQTEKKPDTVTRDAQGRETTVRGPTNITQPGNVSADLAKDKLKTDQKRVAESRTADDILKLVIDLALKAIGQVLKQATSGR
jgi:hypothetical protein